MVRSSSITQIIRLQFLLVALLLSSDIRVEADDPLAPAEIQGELDRRKELLDSLVATQDVHVRVELGERVRKSEKLLLKQDLPEDLRNQLLDEHIGLLTFLADYYELEDPARELAFWNEIIAARETLHGTESHWQIAMAKAQLARVQISLGLDDEQRVALAKARDLYQQGESAQKLGDFQSAELLQRECARIHREVLGPNCITTGYALRIYGNTLMRMNRHVEGAQICYLAAKIVENMVGDSPLLANILADAASGLMHVGEARQALELQQRAVKIARNIPDFDSGEAAVHLNNLAYYLSEVGDTAQALAIAEDAGAMFAELGDKPAQADNANLTGTLAMKADEPVKAMASFRKAAELQTDVHGPQHFTVAVAYGNAAQAAMTLNRVREAESFAAQSLSIIDQTIGRQNPRAADILIQYASIQRKLGNKKEAAKLVRQGCQLLAERYGTDHPAYAMASLDLAVVEYESGQKQLAEATILHAAEVFEQKLGRQSWALAVTLTRLAQFQALTQQRQLARQALEVATEIAKEALGEENAEYADHLSRAANIYLDIEEQGLAKASLMQAIELIDKEYGDKHPEYALAVSKLGHVLLETDEKSRGAELLEHGQQLLLDYLGQEHPDVITAATDVARAHRLLNNPEQAVAELVDLESIVKDELGTENEVYAELLLELGRSLLVNGSPQQAEKPLLDAANLFADQMSEQHPRTREALELIALARSGNREAITNEAIKQVEQRVLNLEPSEGSPNLDATQQRHQRVADMMKRLVR